MNVLPKLLFLFQTIPILRGVKIFKEWQRSISRYIWQGKKPRIKYKLLTDAKERGGFALPDLKLYYEASCLCWVRDWIKLKNTKLLDLEGFDNRFGWHAYLWQEGKKGHQSFGNHIFRKSLIEVWIRYKNILERGVPHWLSPLEMMGIKQLNMRSNWVTYGDLVFKEGDKWTVKPYEQVKEHVRDWLHYWQISNMFKKEVKEKGYEEKDSKFQTEIVNNDRKTISKMYKILLEWHTMDEEVKEVMIHWARDLGYSIELEEWQKIWNQNLKFTACITLKENAMKMVYRWYLTLVKLAKMYKICNKCWRCREKEGTFMPPEGLLGKNI